MNLRDCAKACMSSVHLSSRIGPCATYIWDSLLLFSALFHILHMCICVFVNLYLCIWQSKISFLMSLDPWPFENIAHVGYFWHFITVYLCICVFVFVYLCIWQSRISFLMSLDHWLFKNISIYRVFLTLSQMLYLCICVLVFVYLCIWQSRISFLMSLDHWLFKNIAL